MLQPRKINRWGTRFEDAGRYWDCTWRLYGRATWYCHLTHERRQREIVAFRDVQHLKISERRLQGGKAARDMRETACVNTRARTWTTLRSPDSERCMAGMADKAFWEWVHSQEVLLELHVERIFNDISFTIIIAPNAFHDVMNLRGQIRHDAAEDSVSEFVIELPEI